MKNDEWDPRSSSGLHIYDHICACANTPACAPAHYTNIAGQWSLLRWHLLCPALVAWGLAHRISMDSLNLVGSGIDVHTKAPNQLRIANLLCYPLSDPSFVLVVVNQPSFPFLQRRYRCSCCICPCFLHPVQNVVHSFAPLFSHPNLSLSFSLVPSKALDQPVQPCDWLYLLPWSYLMIHCPLGTQEGQVNEVKGSKKVLV